MTGAGKVFIKTYGCQMNVYDSDRMADILAREGYRGDGPARRRRSRPPQHLPHPREGRREGLFRGRAAAPPEGGRARARRATCGSPSPAASPRRRAPRSSGARPRSTSVVGPQSLSPAAGAPRQIAAGRAVVRPTFPPRTSSTTCRRRRGRAGRRQPRSSRCRRAATSSAPSASCPIRAAPRSRGRSRRSSRRRSGSRRGGVRELTLLGQNVNAYHGEGTDGRRLVARACSWSALADIPGIARLRYTTSHPRDMDDDLIAAHRDLPTLMPYLHLPVQSGSDRILARDEPPPRRAADYLRLVERLRARAARPRAVRRFHRRLSRRDRRGFRGDAAPRRGGRLRRRLFVQIQPAARHAGGRHGDQVPEDGEVGAAAAPAGADRRAAAAFNAAQVGQRRWTFCSSGAGRTPGQLVGRSPWLQTVQVDATGIADRHDRHGADRTLGTNSLFGALARGAAKRARAAADGRAASRATQRRAPSSAPTRSASRSSSSSTTTASPARSTASSTRTSRCIERRLGVDAARARQSW